MLDKFPSNIKWHEPTADDVKVFEGDSKLLLVANCGMCPLQDKGFDEDRFGHLNILIDSSYAVIFNYDGGGPAPWDEWTVYFYAEFSRSLEHAKQVAELVYSEILADTITLDKWDALGFVKESV